MDVFFKKYVSSKSIEFCLKLSCANLRIKTDIFTVKSLLIKRFNCDKYKKKYENGVL